MNQMDNTIELIGSKPVCKCGYNFEEVKIERVDRHDNPYAKFLPQYAFNPSQCPNCGRIIVSCIFTHDDIEITKEGKIKSNDIH